MQPLRLPNDLADGTREPAPARVRPVTVAVVARRAGTRSALLGLFASERVVHPVGAAADPESAVRLLHRQRPDVVVLHGGTLGEARLRRLSTLAAAAPGAAFVVIGMGDHPGFPARAMAAGAAGYVRLDEAAERLVPAVLEAASER